MSNFKIRDKKKKKKFEKTTTTLDKKHIEKVNKLGKEKSSRTFIEKNIKKINQELEILDKNRLSFTPEDLHHRSNILNELDILKDKLKFIKNNHNEMDYYDRTGDIITDYYNKINEKDTNLASKNILEYLGKKKTNTNKLNSNSKSKLYEKYCKRVNGTRIKKDDGSNRIKYCDYCKVEKSFDYKESSYICPCCGDMETVIIDEDRQIKEYSPYKRINHFREWLNQFQAKESTEIPDEIYSSMLTEINKMRITNLAKLEKKLVREILKRLGYNKYYEHIPYIINKLNNIPPPKISRQMEKIFIKMFKEIQKPWEIFKPKGRKNFLSYSYILHKFCELLDLDHLLHCFPLLKSHTKLKEQDEVWNNICNYQRWEFYPSFK
jgi:hypothetical protein